MRPIHTGLLPLLLVVLACATNETARPEPSDTMILDTLPLPGRWDWPVKDSTRIKTERNRREQEKARQEAEARAGESGRDSEGLKATIDAWSTERATSHSGPLAAWEAQDMPDERETSEKNELVVAPIPFANPTIGAGLYVVAGYIFRIDPEDRDSPPSAVGVGGMLSTNGSRAVGLGGQLHLDEDRWRVSGALGYADVNYTIYDVGKKLGFKGRDIDIGQSMVGFQFGVLRYVGEGFYVGPVYRGFTIDTDVNQGRAIAVGPFEFALPTVRTRESSVGLKLERDLRDDKFYPRSGSHLVSTVRVFRESLGGDHDYEIYELGYDSFDSLTPRTVLAGRVFGRYADGGVPFYGLSYLGSLPDIRGYEVGRHQDRLLVAAQVELRQELGYDFGATVFAGFGQVAGSFSELTFEDFLPGLGAGLLKTIAKKNHINLRADVAWGVDGWVFYFGVGQNF
jgi:hypothetical protein